MTTHLTSRELVTLTPTEVADLLADSDFIRWRCARNASMSEELVSHDATADRIRVHTRASVPLEWMPDAVRARLQSSPSIDRYEDWVRPDLTGVARFDITGVAADVSGSMDVTPTREGSVVTYHLKVTVRVPFIGTTIERAVGQQISGALAGEAAALENYRSETSS